MATTKERDPRISKREYTQRVAKRAGVPLRVAATVYEAMIEEIIEIVNEGKDLTLAGFGKFYSKPHKGHNVQFAAAGRVEDYNMLKFSATRAVNQMVKAPVKIGSDGDDKAG